MSEVMPSAQWSEPNPEEEVFFSPVRFTYSSSPVLAGLIYDAETEVATISFSSGNQAAFVETSEDVYTLIANPGPGVNSLFLFQQEETVEVFKEIADANIQITITFKDDEEIAPEAIFGLVGQNYVPFIDALLSVQNLVFVELEDTALALG